MVNDFEQEMDKKLSPLNLPPTICLKVAYRTVFNCETRKWFSQTSTTLSQLTYFAACAAALVLRRFCSGLTSRPLNS